MDQDAHLKEMAAVLRAVVEDSQQPVRGALLNMAQAVGSLASLFRTTRRDLNAREAMKVSLDWYLKSKKPTDQSVLMDGPVLQAIAQGAYYVANEMERAAAVADLASSAKDESS